MLGPADLELIRECGYCTLHEPRTVSMCQGEPFLRDGILRFFDGRKLLVCGYSLEPASGGMSRSVEALVRHCLASDPVEVLAYCGPEEVALRRLCPSKFRRIFFEPATPAHAEMVLDCHEEPKSSRLRQWLRSAQNAAFQVREVPLSTFPLGVAHLRLIERFFSSRESTPVLLDMAFLLGPLAFMPHVRWFEAYREGALCGLAAVVDAFRDMDLALFLATDPAAAGASDSLYAAMRDSTRSRRKRYLNLGPSPSAGHYSFKEKWGAKPLVPSYYYCEWGAGELALGDYNSWPSRLAQYGFRPAVT
ncbi:MAG: hypothetical protein HY236_08875 [Acidobacteria bacterium]|nr:hypothetical protein [Acidobacteriota bacterium]